MEIELAEDAPPGWSVLTASGEIDVTSVSILRSALAELLDDGRARVIVDLDEVDFVDSTGVEALVAAAERARDLSGDVRVACSNSRIHKVLELARVGQALIVADSPAETASAPALGVA